MKLLVVAASVLMMPLLWIAPAQAVNSDHRTQLLETRICIGCDVSSANFLMEATLKNARLKNVSLASVTPCRTIAPDGKLSQRDCGKQGEALPAPVRQARG